VPGFLAIAKTVDPTNSKPLRDFFLAVEKVSQLDKTKRDTELGELAKKLQ
jgi:hypothetical protein